MGIPVQEVILDPWAEKGPQTTEDVIERHMAVRIGRLTAFGMVFRAATEEEVLAHEERNPEAHARLLDNVIENLALTSTIPEEYTAPHIVRDSNAA